MGVSEQVVFVLALVAGGMALLLLWVRVANRVLAGGLRHFLAIWLRFRREGFAGRLLICQFADYVCVKRVSEKRARLREFLFALQGHVEKGRGGTGSGSVRNWEFEFFVDQVMRDLAAYLKNEVGREREAAVNRLFSISEEALK